MTGSVQMRKKQMGKAACDGLIILQTVLLAVLVWHQQMDSEYLPWYLAALFLCAGTAAADLYHQLFRKGAGGSSWQQEEKGLPAVQELLLLDEQNKPVRSWNMAGRTSMVIGRRNDEEEVDVDLEDCAYSTFVECQHAALNFCLDRWYLEDLGSVNGVRIQKAADGCCYQVTSRPCRVEAGDIIHIANTRLLLS